MLTAFIVGLLTPIPVMLLWTNKYLKGQPEESFNKFIIYTVGTACVLNFIILGLIL